ncbi:MAG: hypothetical protein AAGG06_16660 [Pseudomonadota bacterium]
MRNSRNRTRLLRRALFLLCSAQLAGCAAVAVEGGSVALDKARVQSNIDAALAGDPQAQYAVGAALCCSGDVAEGSVYSTAEAMRWLCAAANQGDTKAMLKLAQIFEGDQVDGLRIVRRAMTAVADTPQNLAAAHYWYSRAEASGGDGAADMAGETNQAMTTAEKEAVAQYAAGAEPPCEWADLKSSPIAGGGEAPAPELGQ